LINARCETMDVLPTFQESFLHRRCVVPVTGYYECKQEVSFENTLALQFTGFEPAAWRGGG
jgi:putative SOS response-associated peptidase YedK